MTQVCIGNLAALGVLGVAACVGNIGDGSGGAAPSSGGSAGESSAGGPVATNGSGGSDAGFGQGVVSGQACTKGASFAPARLSLVSDDQYRNIVHDVFGVTFPAATNVTAASSNSGSYAYDEGAALQATTVQEYQRAADTVASLIASMPPCTTGGVNATCMEAYLRNTLPRAWRRPVTNAELAGLMAIFNMPNVQSSTRQIQLTMEAALIHPAFLFRSEIGGDAATGTGKAQLTAYELASALSFAVLNSVPDPELWAKAQDGSLTQPAVLAAQATRLIALPAVQANLMKKVSYYLDFEKLPVTQKDPKTYPSFATLQPTLYQSSQMFLSSILWTGHFNDLFTTKTIYANQAMAAAYGLPPVSGTQLQPVTPPGDMYGGGGTRAARSLGGIEHQCGRRRRHSPRSVDLLQLAVRPGAPTASAERGVGGRDVDRREHAPASGISRWDGTWGRRVRLRVRLSRPIRSVRPGYDELRRHRALPHD